MQIGRKIRGFVGIAVICTTFMIMRPAYAFVWPTIDIAEVASIINDVTNGIAKVTGAVAQIKNYTATIEAVGNPRDLIAKYSKEVKSSLVEIKSNVSSSLSVVDGATSGIIQVAEDVNTQITKSSVQEEENTKITTKDVETAINTGEKEETVLSRIEKTIDDINFNNNEDENLLKLAQDHISQQTNESQKVINDLVEGVVENGDMDNDAKNDLKNQAKQVEEKVNAYNKHAKDILDDLQEKITEKNKTVQYAYNEYSTTVQSYYKGDVKQDTLENVGKKLNDTVQTTKVGINEEKLQGLAEESQNISKEIIKLREAIFDNISNNKEYSDEDEQTDKVSALDIKKNVQYAYHNHNEYRNFHLKGIYADQAGGDKSFLLSYEFGSDRPSRCKQLDFEDIENDKIDKFVNNLQDCVNRAKAERDYFCPGAPAEELMKPKCDPYVIESIRFTPQQKEGVYKHILQDYNVENGTNLDKTKQYVSTWLDTDNNESTLKKLLTQIGHLKDDIEAGDSNINDQHNTMGLISIITLEGPKLWSLIRRADALIRAKTVVDLYRQQETLYIDARDGDYVSSEEMHLGLVEESDGKTKVNVISNGILYGCETGAKGDTISVKPEEKYNQEKVEKAEETIKDCFYVYAEGASRGTREGIPDKDMPTIDMAKEKWKIRKIKVHSDSMFHTLALGTINNYKSSLDYKKNLKSGQKNILTLDENIKSVKNIIDDYTSGAEIINYSTRQLVSIIDADAQELQSEIISDLKSMGYDYFDKDVKVGGGVL